MRLRIFLLILLTSVPGVPLAAPAAEFWPFWVSPATREGTASKAIDHSVWQALLDCYLVTDNSDGINRFRYDAMDPADRKRLDNYIDALGSLDPRQFSRQEQMAYWINLYNALTVRIVLEHLNESSILDMGSGFFTIGPWDERVVEIAGQALSLNDIEHRILRPLFEDRRVHYAINCASLGCPSIAPRAYTGNRIDAMLDAAEQDYVNHPRGVQLQTDGLVLSQIFEWYRDDFATDEAGLLTYLASIVREPLAARLRAYKGKIRYQYDWSLNAAR